jgi:hypothetical protein
MSYERQILKTEGLSEMRLEWNNRRVRHDRFLFWFLVCFWIIWTPFTVFGTSMIFRSDSPIFLLFGAFSDGPARLVFRSC